MNMVRNAGKLVFGALPLLVGCAQLGIDLGDEPEMEVMGGGETSKPNGLDPDVGEACAEAVMAAMNLPLVVLQNNGVPAVVLNPALPASIQPSGECVKSFGYAVACALEDGATLPGYGGDYEGQEILTGTGGWLTSGPLTYAQKSSVLTCMTALMNTHSGVDVCLGGADINGSPGACVDFDYPEAVFLTLPDALERGVISYVWPMIPPTVCDPQILEDVYAQRVCGQPPQTGETPLCQAEIRGDYAQACEETNGEILCEVCQETNGVTTCQDLQAIKTRLTAGGFETMYPECLPTPQ